MSRLGQYFWTVHPRHYVWGRGICHSPSGRDGGRGYGYHRGFNGYWLFVPMFNNSRSTIATHLVFSNRDEYYSYRARGDGRRGVGLGVVGYVFEGSEVGVG